MWTWLRVISTGLRGVAATETTSVPLKRPLLTALCRRLLVPDLCGDQDRFRAAGLTCLEPPESDRHWKVRLHGALCLRPTDQSCHHETWLHLDFVDWQDVQPHREKYNRRVVLKERPAPYLHGKQKGRISDVRRVLCGQRVHPHQVT